MYTHNPGLGGRGRPTSGAPECLHIHEHIHTHTHNADSSLWCFVLDTGQRYKLEKREHKQYETKLSETRVSSVELSLLLAGLLSSLAREGEGVRFRECGLQCA